jgi:hypothetical protein
LKRTLTLAGLLILLALSPVRATQLDGLEGTWEGFLAPNALVEVRVIVRVEKGPDGALRAKTETPDVKQPSPEFDDVTLKDGAVAIVSKEHGRGFRGTINPGGTELVGELRGTKGTLPLKLTRFEGPVTIADIREGTLVVKGEPRGHRSSREIGGK